MDKLTDDELIKAINRGGVSRQLLDSYDLPVITPEELKVIEFEIRARTLNSAVVGLDHSIRNERQTQNELLSNLNYMMKENGVLHSARMREVHGGHGAAQEYFRTTTFRMLTEYARSLATEKKLRAEREEANGSWQPIFRIAEGMRQELTRKQAEANREAAAARPPRQITAEELEAARRYELNGGPTDDLPDAQTSARRRAEQDAGGQSRDRVLPTQVTTQKSNPARPIAPPRVVAAPMATTAASSNWLTDLQSKAYGVKDGQ